jgi:hypothetical protein
LLSLWLIGSLVSAVKLDSTSNEPLLLTKDYFSGAYNILGANQNSISYISLNFWIQSQTGVDKLIIAHKSSESSFALTSLNTANFTQEFSQNFDSAIYGSPLVYKYFPARIIGNKYYIMTSPYKGSPNGLVSFDLIARTTTSYLQLDRIYIGGGISAEKNEAYLLHTSINSNSTIPSRPVLDVVDLTTLNISSTHQLSADFCPSVSLDSPPPMALTINGAYLFFVCQPKFDNITKLNEWYFMRYEPNKNAYLRNVVSLNTNYKPVSIMTDIESAGFLLFESKDNSNLSHLYKWPMNKGLDFISFEIQNTTGYAFDSKFVYLFTKDAALTKIEYSKFYYDGTSLIVPKSDEWRKFDFSCGVYYNNNKNNESVPELWLGTQTADVIIEFKLENFCNKDVICRPDDANKPPNTLLVIEVVIAVGVAVVFAAVITAMVLWQIRVKKEEDQERLLNANSNEGDNYGTL